MIKKLLELLYKALEKMVGYKSITDAFDLNDSIISDKMSDSMELWKAMYKDESPWLDESKGIYSLGLAKQICQSLQQQTLSEMETFISAPGETEEVEEDKDEVIDTKAKFLNDIYKKRFIKNLPQAFEKGLALGGMIVKPYINNTQLYLDFVYYSSLLYFVLLLHIFLIFPTMYLLFLLCNKFFLLNLFHFHDYLNLLLFLILALDILNLHFVFHLFVLFLAQ